VTRTDPPHHGSEREILEFLEYQRSTVFMTAGDLSDADAAKQMFPFGSAKRIRRESFA